LITWIGIFDEGEEDLTRGEYTGMFEEWIMKSLLMCMTISGIQDIRGFVDFKREKQCATTA
jgi:hypothetical protein